MTKKVVTRPKSACLQVFAGRYFALHFFVLILCAPLYIASASAMPMPGGTPGPHDGPPSITPTAVPSPTATPPVSHRECSDAGRCMRVDTPGEDECSGDPDCMMHFCDLGGSCNEFPGDPSASNCSDANPCKRACVNGLCILRIPGVPDDAPACSAPEDCAHYECEGKSCVLKPSPGENTCKGAGDCAPYTMCLGSKCVASSLAKNHDCNTNDDCMHRRCIDGSCRGWQPGPGPDECSGDADCGHRVCNGTACSQVAGLGSDECSSSMDCSRLICQNGSCTAVAGKGEDACKSHADCGPTHRACESGFCNIVPGIGADQCSSDAGCSHKGCQGGRCYNLDGPGLDTCSTDRECYRWGCDTNTNMCLRKPYPGGKDSCASHSDCGHRVCLAGNKCGRDFGPGIDKCSFDRDCGSSHRVCVKAGNLWECKQIAGAGENQCSHATDCYLSQSNRAGASQESTSPSVSPATAPTFSPEQVRNLLDPTPVELSFIPKQQPIKIVMFQDLSCGMCGLFYRELLPQLTRDYIETGKIRFETREFPLGGRQKERDLAELALCAGDQKQYQQFIDWLFKEKRKENPSIDAVATGLKLDSKRLKTCIKSGAYKRRVQSDINLGNLLGIDGTPTFFIDGNVLNGVQGYDRFKGMIEDALAVRAKSDSNGQNRVDQIKKRVTTTKSDPESW